MIFKFIFLPFVQTAKCFHKDTNLHNIIVLITVPYIKKTSQGHYDYI